MRTVICPGSFNPVTLGHINLFERCSRLFDEVVVVVMHNAEKIYQVSAEQRVEWIKRSVTHLQNVRVEAYGGLLVDFARQCGAQLLIKGMRDTRDLITETQMYYANREASGGTVDTLFLPTDERYSYLSSSIVRDVASYGGNISSFVPRDILEEVAKTYFVKRPLR